ncbi:hypothetical protein [Actinophytocola sp.]|uniref:hypothetical protein n=1 Tax=Actinophytocola sp. TaxID=1872138 RepID=UPI002ED12AFF
MSYEVDGHDVSAVLQAEQLHMQTHGSPDSTVAVFNDLLETSDHIRGVRDELHGVLHEIRGLGGWGPVGAERALAGYLAELADLDTVLTRTAALYMAIEEDDVEQLGRAAHDDG